MQETQISLRFEPPPQHDITYFALRPDGPAADAAMELARQCRRRNGLSGRPYDASRLHVSLCPAMSRRGPRKGDTATALRAAARVQAHGFDIGFDRLCTFGRGERRAIVLCCNSGANLASSLRGNLVRELVRSGLGWGRGKFTPHLTLLWDRSSVAEVHLDAPICWTVRDFVLIRSHVGCSRHVDLGRWQLAMPQN